MTTSGLFVFVNFFCRSYLSIHSFSICWWLSEALKNYLSDWRFNCATWNAYECKTENLETFPASLLIAYSSIYLILFHSELLDDIILLQQFRSFVFVNFFCRSYLSIHSFSICWWLSEVLKNYLSDWQFNCATWNAYECKTENLETVFQLLCS